MAGMHAESISILTSDHQNLTRARSDGHFAGNPYISFNKNERVIEGTIQTFGEVVGRIEQKDFAIPARPEKACKECDMESYCNAKNWTFRSAS